MKFAKVDKQGFLIKDVVTNKTPTIREIRIVDGEEVEIEVNDPHYISTPCPNGFYKPKWDFANEVWVEGATQEYIDSLRGNPQPSDQERLEALELAMMEVILNG